MQADVVSRMRCKFFLRDVDGLVAYGQPLGLLVHGNDGVVYQPIA